MTDDALDLAALTCRRLQAQRLHRQVLAMLARERETRLERTVTRLQARPLRQPVLAAVQPPS